MGQYYKVVNMDKMMYLSPDDYNNSIKLMGHSWLTNDFMSVVELLIKKGGIWYKNRIVWAGDYADPEPNMDNNLYNLCQNKIIPKLIKKNVNQLRYLVNFDTKEFIDMKKVPVSNTYVNSDGKVFEYKIHPLPLLTNESNGLGGGDYFGDDPNNIIGKWARNRITIRKTKPSKNYTEIVFNLTEKNVT